jgi:hypothetical protein
MTTEQRFIARVSAASGRKLYETAEYASRDEAALAAFHERPTARSCSTARAVFVDGRWQSFGSDIRWHDRPANGGMAEMPSVELCRVNGSKPRVSASEETHSPICTPAAPVVDPNREG